MKRKRTILYEPVCRSCRFVVEATTDLQLAKMRMEDHLEKSHHTQPAFASRVPLNDYKELFKVLTTVDPSPAEVATLRMAQKRPAFYRALHLPKVPLVSAQGNGEYKLFLKWHDLPRRLASTLKGEWKYMGKGNKSAGTQQETVPAQEPVVVPAVVLEGEQRVAMLEGFADLIAEQYGYKFAKKEVQKDLNEATAVNRKKFSEFGKTISGKIEELIETPSAEAAQAIKGTRKERAHIAELLKKSRTPFQEKVKPINAAIKYIEKVSIPDALNYLGKPVVPLFSVSEEIQKGIEQEKAAKAAAA